MSRQVIKIFGSPGCGKTEYTMRMIEKHIAAGIPPERIAFVSFTRQAVDVAKKRAMAAFALQEHQLPYFRTIHSLCFRLLNMQHDRCMDWRSYRELGNTLGLEFGGGRSADGGDLYGMNIADRMRFVENLARVTQQPLIQTWEAGNDPEIQWLELERYARGLEQYKQKQGQMDFTDLLSAFLSTNVRLPKLEVLIGDEMQDTSPLGWAVMDKLTMNIPNVYFAGDDDQCSISGTAVTTTRHGEVLIDDLDPAIHRLICYDKKMRIVWGFGGGAEFTKAEYDYDGEVITVHAGGRHTTVTPDHWWYVKFGRNVKKVQAKDLPAELFLVPVLRGKEHRYMPAKSTRSHYKGKIFGLDVNRFHTYVADGIITCNCIHRWAGADVNKFLAQPGETVVLDQSYRVPSAIHPMAMQIANQISVRQPKTWKAKQGEPGSYRYHPSMDSVDISKGTWLLLARNGYALEAVEEMCESDGYSFQSVGKSPLDNPSLKAVILWESLRRGASISEQDLKKVIRYTHRSIRVRPEPARTYNLADVWNADVNGPAPIWHEALELIPERERQYYIAVRKRGEALMKKPRISISTIHSVKGGEADNVMLLTDVSSKTFETQQTHPDDELRVKYVAVTRARNELHIVQPQTPRFFEV